MPSFPFAVHLICLVRLQRCISHRVGSGRQKQGRRQQFALTTNLNPEIHPQTVGQCSATMGEPYPSIYRMSRMSRMSHLGSFV